MPTDRALREDRLCAGDWHVPAAPRLVRRRRPSGLRLRRRDVLERLHPPAQWRLRVDDGRVPRERCKVQRSERVIVSGRGRVVRAAALPGHALLAGRRRRLLGAAVRLPARRSAGSLDAVRRSAHVRRDLLRDPLRHSTPARAAGPHVPLTAIRPCSRLGLCIGSDLCMHSAWSCIRLGLCSRSALCTRAFRARANRRRDPPPRPVEAGDAAGATWSRAWSARTSRSPTRMERRSPEP